MGVYSTPGVVLNSAGSIGMALILWTLGSLVAFCGFFNSSEGDIEEIHNLNHSRVEHIH